ncbi:TRRAP [Mytilus edulis]|uniref:TRRAP n=1 Tax=Mytilus edulis TaxID=6550 RepID=A0A8S3PVA4_MYTED|nr:TRRAP [Mytilus edulis]
MLQSPLSPHDLTAQLTTFKSYVALIADPTPGIVEKKLKAAQELSENFESVVQSPQYPQFLCDALKVFLKILDDGEPQFIAEQNMQQLRKLMLEIIHRIPSNEHLKKYVQQILSLMFKLLKIENEENVIVCLRIIIELHKQYRPQYNEEIKDFLQFVKNIYNGLPNHLPKIFEPRNQIKVKDVTEINVDQLLQETFTTTTILTDKKNADNQNISYNIIPKGTLSLKVLAELPIIVVLMYQLYKPNVHQEVAEFIPLIMNTIILQPSAVQRASPSFNKEIFVDFIAAQIKTLSFLAYIIRIYQEQVQTHSAQMVKGLLGLLTFCPQEVAHLRKELLIAARHILATDLRNKFVTCIDQLFDENVLIGTGWTTYESLRPLAYSTLADLVHHVRQSLPLSNLSLAVNLFSKNVHDDSLPSSIQTMSCKLLLNLVECIRAKSEQDNGNYWTINYLPSLLNDPSSKDKDDKVWPDKSTNRFGITPGQTSTYTVNDCRSLVKTLVCGVKTITWGIVSCKATGTEATTIPAKQFLPKETLVYIRLVKYALQALDIYTINVSPTGQAVIRPAVVQSVRTKEEKEVLEHFAGVFNMMHTQTFKEIFSTTVEIVANSFLANPTTSPTFATILVDYLLARLEEMGSNMDRSNLYLKLFKLVFGSVSLFAAENEQMLKPHLHVIVNRSMELAMSAKEPYNYFLLLRALFRSIGGGSHDLLYQEFLPLLPNLLQGLNSLQSGLHRQHMKDLFVELCLTVPVRLSSLLPYLPMLMDPLVSALNGSQTLVSQGLRTLELCVDNLQPDFLYDHIQPVRAELMQALWKTLRNPVDNIAHVAFRVLGKFGGGNRKMLREPQRAIDAALTALKCSTTENFVRRQAWELIKCFLVSVMNLEDDKQTLTYLFTHTSFTENEVPLQTGPLYKTPDSHSRKVHEQALTGMFVAAAIKELRQTALPFMACMVRHYTMISISQQTGMGQTLHNDFYLSRQVWVRHYTMIYISADRYGQTLHNDFYLSADRYGQTLHNDFYLSADRYGQTLHNDFYLSADRYGQTLHNDFYLSADRYGQTLHNDFYLSADRYGQTLHNDFYLSADRYGQTLHNDFYLSADRYGQTLHNDFYLSADRQVWVRHYTMISISQQTGMGQTLHNDFISQQTGPFPVGDKQNKLHGMDTQILIDALAVIMGHEEKELCKPGNLALVLILDTATTILGSKEKACRLPTFDYLVERMCSLCYERAWYAKVGGCLAIKFMYERMALNWVLEHQFSFLKALLFVMMDLTKEVSSGAVDLAKHNLENMLVKCSQEITQCKENEELLAAQKKSFHEVTHELVRQITSPNTIVREQAMHSLEILAKTTKKSITEIMEPHKDVLQDMIPPKKHLLRHQPANAQIGLMDGNTFCTTLEPRLFTIDLNVLEHNVFFTELLSLCEAEDAVLLKLPCYKSVTDLVPLRKSALRALAACHYIANRREKIFNVLYKALNSNSTDLQEVSHNCMKKFISGCQIDMESVHQAIRPLLLTLGDHRSLNSNVIKRLSYITQLFPNTFNEKLCEQLLTHLKKWLEVAAISQKSGQSKANGEVIAQELKTCASIINIFHMIPAASQKLIEPLVVLTLHGEKAMFLEAGSPFRDPLVKFLLRYPDTAIELFLQESHLQDQQWTRLFEFVLAHKDGKPLREILEKSPQRLIALTQGQSAVVDISASPTSLPTGAGTQDMQYQMISIISILVRCEEEWLSKNVEIDSVDYIQWKEPALLVKCLLNYFKYHIDEVELLFNVLRCFTYRYIVQFQFVKDYLEKTVAATYTIDWKRNSFFKFVDLFHDPSWSQDLKSKILQYVIIPCCQHAFESGDGEKLIGGPPTPDQDSQENVISVFINRIIDPDKPFGTSDAVRILLLQLSSLLVEQASSHIHDANNK